MTERAPLESAEVTARKIGERLAEKMPPGWGFTLVLASYGEGGFCTYISSVQREGAVKMLHELLDKIERNEQGA